MEKIKYTEEFVTFTFEANFFLNAKIQDQLEGKINLKRRQESFADWKEFLLEREEITEDQFNSFKYVGKEEMYS